MSSRFTPTRVGKIGTRQIFPGCRAVHPHTRGENCCFVISAVFISGSPPHAWGKSTAYTPEIMGKRFTPTRVGKMSAWRPHRRLFSGSPPHAWGKFWKMISQPSQKRFTPTRVGKISRCSCNSRYITVHPHTRGENSSSIMPTPTANGSPPHAWGKCNTALRCFMSSRFTPTRVGKIISPVRMPVASSVHPHTRGENGTLDRWPAAPSGSPPHAWGKLPKTGNAEVDLRFTPTRVGKMHDATLPAWEGTVHPHTRGENCAAAGTGRRHAGSPPHAWGKFSCAVPPRILRRFTPTRVGKMPRCGHMRQMFPVHPHTRGENCLTEEYAVEFDGSPPHAWGKCHGGNVPPVRTRFTPTRVGKIIAGGR